MKSLTNRFVFFAATAAFFGATAFGQTAMKGEVPFAFTIPGGASEAAGHYVIHLDAPNGSKVLRLYNIDTRHSTLAVTFRTGGPFDKTDPRLVFRCGDEGCVLSEVWTADGGYTLPQGKIRHHQYLASIPLTIHLGD